MLGNGISREEVLFKVVCKSLKIWSMMYVLPNPNWLLQFCLCLPAHHLNHSSTCLLLILCPQDWFVDSLSDTFVGPLASSMCPGMLRSACFRCVSISGCCFAACMVMKLVLKRALRSPSVAWIVYTWWTDLSRDESASPGISYSIWGSGIKFYMREMPWYQHSCTLAGIGVHLLLVFWYCRTAKRLALLW